MDFSFKRRKLDAILCDEIRADDMVKQSTVDELRCQLNQLRKQYEVLLLRLNEYQYQSGRHQPLVDDYKRQKGKRLSEDERRDVLHCVRICKAEKANWKYVSTADPIQRVASYLGMSHNTVRDVVLGRKTIDLRCKARQS